MSPPQMAAALLNKAAAAAPPQSTRPARPRLVALSALAHFFQLARTLVLPALAWLMLVAAPLAALAATDETTPAPRQAASDAMLDVGNPGQQSVLLTHHFDVMEDASAQLRLDDVRSSALAGKFVRDTGAGEALSFGYTPSAYWLRLRLRNDSDAEVEKMLSIGYGLISDIRLYQPGVNGYYQETRTGLLYPFAGRPYPSRIFVFPLKLMPHAQQTLYFRVQSNIAILVPAKLWSKAAFYDNERNEYMVQTCYFGMVIAMVLFNLLLALLLRETIYMRYILYMSCMALAIGCENGLTTQYLWPNAPVWAEMAADTLSTFALCGMLMFTREMLTTKTSHPKIDLLLRILIGMQALTLLAVLISFVDCAKYATQAAEISGMTILLVGIYCAIRRQRSAWFFLAAFTPFIIGGMLTSLRTEGSLPSNFLTANGVQIGSALEMLLLAFALADRFNNIMKGREQAQKQALAAQQSLLENLQSSERMLEKRIYERTSDLATSVANLAQVNEELQQAWLATESSRQQLEQARAQSTKAMEDLRSFEPRLLQSEKMAALGQLVTGIANEINVPLRMVKANGKHIGAAMHKVFQNLPTLFRILTGAQMALFLQMIRHGGKPESMPGPSDTRKISQQLQQAGTPNARHAARMLIDLNVQSSLPDFIPLMQHPQSELIIDTAYQAAVVIHGTEKINTAVDQVSKIVFALKSFSHFDMLETKIESDLPDGMETILTIHQNQFKHGITLVRDFQPIPRVACLPGELNQVWNNLIQNALDAMPNHGTLTVGMAHIGDEVVVSVTDTGCGIEARHIGRIFEAFYTTKGNSRNNGLGLCIVRKIIDKHGGKILVESEPGQGSCFRVHLPCSRLKQGQER